MPKGLYIGIILVIIGLLVGSILLIVKKKGKESIFNVRTYIMGPLSFISLAICKSFSDYLNNKLVTYFLDLPSLYEKLSDKELQLGMIITFIAAIVMWLILIAINIYKLKWVSIPVTLLQMILSAIAAVLMPLVIIIILCALFLYIALFYLPVIMILGGGGTTPKPDRYRLTDRYGVPVDSVRDRSGRSFHVDGQKIQDAQGRYVTLREDANGDYIDEYGKRYY